jgi:acetylornithine/LysW-gamma-L-lysine aminotransferase
MAGREGIDAPVLPDRWLSPLPSVSAQDLRVVKAEGNYVWDDEGARYLDLVTNGGVNVLGHAHPQVTAALATQLAELTSAHPDVASDAREELIEALSVIVPAPLTKVVLTNSGSEAVDFAVKIAFAATRRRRVIAMQRAHHGATFLASLLSDSHTRAALPEQGIHVTRVPFNDLDAIERELDNSVAAVIVEPLQWEAGVYVASDGYLRAVQQMCRKRGALLVVDEVQTAVRTWPPLLSARQGMAPDILCLGPSIANGFPLGAVVMVDAVAAKGARAASTSSVAGNPLACAAGIATIRAIVAPAMRARIVDSSSHLHTRLRALRMSEIKEVRGEGTMAAVELYSGAPAVVRMLRKSGVLVAPAPTRVIRLLPPLTIDKRQIDFAVEKLAAAIFASRGPRRSRKIGEADVELRGVPTRRPARSA